MLVTRIPVKACMVAAFSLIFLSGGTGSAYGSTPAKKADAAHYLVSRHDRLTLKTDKTPLVQLVEEIAVSAGIEIVTASTMYADQLVSADIEDGPVLKVIEALLEGYNYLIFFPATAPPQGLQLLSGTTSAPVGEKLLVLTENGCHYQLVQGGFPPDTKGKVAGATTTGDPGLASRAYTPNALSFPLRSTVMPASIHDRKEEKSDMRTRETSSAETAAAEINASSWPKTESSLINDDGEGVAEYGPADAPCDTDVVDEDPEQSADASFAREDYLRYQIDKLSARIESGYSDLQFEFWSQKKEPKYLTNDRDLLARYEKELRALEEKE